MRRLAADSWDDTKWVGPPPQQTYEKHYGGQGIFSGPVTPPSKAMLDEWARQGVPFLTR